MQKNVQNCTPDSQTSFNVKMGNLKWGKISVSKLGLKNVKMGKMGKTGKKKTNTKY